MSDAVLWYRDAAVRRFLVFGYLPWLAGFNLAWEVAQLPLYTLWTSSSTGYLAFAVAHCTLGDALIGSGAVLASLIVLRASALGQWRWVRIAACTTTLGVAYTVFSEWINLTVLGSWAYSARMPLIPLGGVEIGASPLAQWLLVPPLALALGRKARLE
ncbi:MAG TPA: hypothetical protein VFV84_08170 [Burkholderiales bacterium]|nr:hypothetical protein [Burkholderiales bacterium]